MELKYIYIIGLILITVYIICIYFRNEHLHQTELNRIRLLEIKHQKKMDALNKIRLLTKPCSKKDLKTPRSCYFESKYKCKWNENAERCDLI